MKMLQKDYGIICQDNGYLSGRCELSDDELETFQDVYENIQKKVRKFDIHIPLPDTNNIDSINNYIQDVIAIIEQMTEKDFKNIILNGIKEIHEEVGMQMADWANGYHYKSSNYDTIMQNYAKKWEIDINDLLTDDIDENEHKNELYDARGSAIAERIIEHLQKQL